MKDIRSAVGASSYPGRGILIGKSSDRRHAFLAYFIMGRSANSRNRIFVADGNGLDLHTEVFDPSKMIDPSLIIYHPVREVGRHIIVTNGDQSDSIRDNIIAGGSFHRALIARTFEPDAPNYTPRISAMLTRMDGDFRLEMSVLRCCDPENQTALRCFYEYDSIRSGEGRFIHTYSGDGEPLPPFTGEPEAVVLGDDFEEFTDAIWTSLNGENKISLWTCSLDLTAGDTRVNIINKYS